MADNEYLAEYAKQGRAKCKHSGCKTLIEKDTARLGKSHPSGFHDGNQVDWYHPLCLFKAFCNAKKGSKLVEDVDDIKGFLMLKKEDKDEITKHLKDYQSGKLKKEVLEEKRKKREDNKKEKELLDKMLNKGGVSSPKKAPGAKKNEAPKNKNSATKNNKKSGPKFIEGLIDSNEEEEERSNDSIDVKQASKQIIQSSPIKKLQSKQTPTPSSPKKLSNNLPEEKLFGAWASSFSSLTSHFSGFHHFSQTHKDSMNLFQIKQTPKVICIGLSPYHHPLLKYDKTTAYNNLLHSISPQENFSVFKWFTSLKERQQFLFLHSPIGESTFDCYWVPLLIKTIKLILKSVQQEKQGIVFALFGNEAHKLSPTILDLYKNQFQQANMRLLQFQEISKAGCINEDKENNNNTKPMSTMNFDKVINGALEEMGLPPVRWYTKKEYVIVLKGEFEGHPIRHVLTQSGNLGRISFADHQISDKRISRDQVKVELIEQQSSSNDPFSLKISVLGRNPIEIQHEREERKILNQCDNEILKIGENFNLILGGDFFQISLAEIAEDGSILDSKGITNTTIPNNNNSKNPSPIDNKKSFSRSISNMDTQVYTPPSLKRSNSSDVQILSSPNLKEVKSLKNNNKNINKTPSPSQNQENKRKRNSNEIDSGRDMRKKGKIVNYKDVCSDEDDFEKEEDEEELEGEDEDEKLARKLQKEFEKENENYKKQKSGKKGLGKRKTRKRNNIDMEDSSEEDTKRIKAEIADGGPDSPYEDDDLWAQDKKEKYKSEDEEISFSDDDFDDDDDDDDGEDVDLGIPAKKIPCQFGVKCYRQNPDHLRRFSHPNK
jgi:hypothetical protein